MQSLIKSTAFRFTAHQKAFAFRDSSKQMMLVILGDDSRFWVVTPADGARLLAAGYEEAL